MTRTRNIKSGTFNQKEHIKLKNILKEVKAQQSGQIAKVKKFAVFNEDVLESIFSSGFLTEQESKSLRNYFKENRIRRIDESSVRRIDEDILRLNEFKLLDKMVQKTKDVAGKVKKGLTDFGDKVVDALAGGWSKLKSVWGEFKELVEEMTVKIKVMFKKIYDWVQSKITGVASKLESYFSDEWLSKFTEKNITESYNPLNEGESKETFYQEVKNMASTAGYLGKYTKDLLSGKQYEADLESGNFKPDEVQPPAGGDEEDIEAQVLAIKEFHNQYTSLFGSKKHLSELYKMSQNSLLREGGHIEDNIQNETVRNIVKVILNGLKFIFSPFSTIAAYVIKEGLKKGLLPSVSRLCKSLGGPGIFKFTIISLMVAEAYEIIEGILSIAHLKGVTDLVKLAIPVIAPFIEMAEGVIHTAHIIIGSWALVTVINNLANNKIIPFLKEKFGGGEEETEKSGEEGGEPEPQTAGYKPSGQFKIQEGKLVFVS